MVPQIGRESKTMSYEIYTFSSYEKMQVLNILGASECARMKR